MNKLELIAVVAGKTGQSKLAVKRSIEVALDTIGEVLAEGGEVVFTGFGTFEARKRSAREGRNPATGEALDIAASVAPVFKPGKALKFVVNRK